MNDVLRCWWIVRSPRQRDGKEVYYVHKLYPWEACPKELARHKGAPKCDEGMREVKREPRSWTYPPTFYEPLGGQAAIAPTLAQCYKLLGLERDVDGYVVHQMI